MVKKMNPLKMLSKLSKNHKIIMTLTIFILVVAVFIPRDSPLIQLGVSGKIGNLEGKVNLETFKQSWDGRMPESDEVLTVAKTKKTFCFFYAPWCGWCKKAKPEFERLVKENPTDVHLVAVNCDEKKDLAKKHQINGFPTFKFYKNGMNGKGVDYTKSRDFNSFVQYLRKM